MPNQTFLELFKKQIPNLNTSKLLQLDCIIQQYLSNKQNKTASLDKFLENYKSKKINLPKEAQYSDFKTFYQASFCSEYDPNQ